jgi:DNA excision repair protein ERCC-8
MNAFLLNRQLGSVTPQALVQAQHDIAHKALEPAENVSFRHKALDGEDFRTIVNDAVAHPAGVNSIAIDRFEGR